ncbi:hypothetical protein QNI16_31065 [Cytophagaceae bacterium YF14B1]|uniref:Uncharacterized protein n=1 Tax=Xanthocytophaga flava TaxID=3048013 RepID=A0AAE3U9Z6_9BACT|nr:hypothetical protein [Xanthocytophaga flavus]MDJ1484981.1 hypothetical protein [Xanthocytophaga flavus]
MKIYSVIKPAIYGVVGMTLYLMASCGSSANKEADMNQSDSTTTDSTAVPADTASASIKSNNAAEILAMLRSR